MSAPRPRLTALLLLAGALGALPAAAGCTGGGEAAKDAERAVRSIATSAPAQAAKDALTAAAIKARLATIDIDSATGVSVAVRDGRVALAGRAASAEQGRRFVAAARSTGGVVSVEDRLTIDPHRRGMREQAGDLALAARVKGSLAAETGVNALAVNVSARDGRVMLAGTVHAASTKASMLQAARRVPGVRSVEDRIRVAP